jgi:hypothetical protein
MKIANSIMDEKNPQFLSIIPPKRKIKWKKNIY